MSVTSILKAIEIPRSVEFVGPVRLQVNWWSAHSGWQAGTRHSRRLAEEVVAGEVVVVHDPEDELVLHVGRGRVDLELEHLVPARVPPLVCTEVRVQGDDEIGLGKNRHARPEP